MFKKIATAAALSVLASASFAATGPFYAGADFGSTEIDNISDRHSSFGGFLGYQFHQNFAVEVGYRRLANFDAYHNTSVTKVGVTMNQAALSLVGSLPLTGGLELFGRFGRNQVEVESSADTSKGDGALYGIGVGYAFSPTISGRFEFQKPTSDSTNVNAGVVFKF